MKSRLRFALATMALFPLAAPAAAQNIDIPAFEQASAETARIAEAYFNAYASMDWDRLEPMLHDEVSFADPTAKQIFQGIDLAGKEAVIGLFRQYNQSLEAMSFEKDRLIASGDSAVMIGTLDWTMRLGPERSVRTQMPFATVITVKDGKVIAHRDYGDYREFTKALTATR